MMIKKVYVSFGGGYKGSKTLDFEAILSFFLIRNFGDGS